MLSTIAMLNTLLIVTAIILTALVLIATHFALIETGREVITLRTQSTDGSWQETRLWIVDEGGIPWLHSGGRAWAARFAGDPIVELQRAGAVHRYRAHGVPGLHPRIHRLLREKYGVADRWVRFFSPDNGDTLVVRLDKLEQPIP